MSDTLNRQVAERLGAKERYDVDAFEDGAIPDGCAIFTSERMISSVCRTIESAWKTIPDWSGSVDKALTLVPKPVWEELSFSLDKVVKEVAPDKYEAVWEATIWHYPAKTQTSQRVGDTPAIAICEAWLAWMDAQDD